MASKNIELIRDHVGPEAFRVVFPAIIPSLRQAGDPDMALNNLERFLGELQLSERAAVQPEVLIRILSDLLVLFGASRFLSTFCIANAADTCRLLSNREFLSRPVDRELLAAQLTEILTTASREEEVLRGFRLFRKREMLRIGLRDLLGKADLSETVSDLSLLAEVSLQEAYAWANRHLQKRYGRPLVLRESGIAEEAQFAVIGMGKLGGGELNFSSDIDLMYVYSADGETEGVPADDGSTSNRITNHQYFVKLSEQISAIIGRNTADGFVFRVDLRLRPEGQQGPLAQSLGGYEVYYQSWGQTWERSALIKARPVAGSEALGREFIERITPFVYRKYLDYGAIAEIRDMKQKINREVQLKGRTNRDVKLGYGGIREIEFLVQSLQLMYGGRDRMLRERGSMKALHILSQKGLLTYQETRELIQAYVFLRMVEHRLQILNDQQTQTLPAGDDDLRSLARRTGYREPGIEAELLLRDYAEHARRVRNIYDLLLAQAAETEEVKEEQDFMILIEPDTTEQESIVVLQRYGFRDPSRACRNIALLREGQAFAHQTPRSRRIFAQLFPKLFREVVASPDPDMALNHLESYLAAQGSWNAFQSFVQQDPRVLGLLLSIFGSSEHFSRMLIRTPSLLLELMETGGEAAAGGLRRYRVDLTTALEKAATITDKLDALRRFKKREELRIGMADLAGMLPFSVVCKGLSRLAEACLDSALRLAAAETAKRFGGAAAVGGDGAGIAIIAAGKLGGREIIYGSDLDILFAYDEQALAGAPAGVSGFEYASKIAEKTISYLTTMTREGAAYRVDTRLRPGGSKGPLITSVAAFQQYYTEKADTWERQAMINTRFVAGDLKVGAVAIDALRSTIYRTEDRAELAAAVSSMRKRMEVELGKENGKHFNLKQGAGGLVDIEFLAQYLQLLHGAVRNRVRVPGTMSALRLLMRERLLSREDGVLLIDAYLFLRKLESRMRIVANQAESLLARDPAKLGPLALRLGFVKDAGTAAGAGLLEKYQKTSREVRLIYERTLGC